MTTAQQMQKELAKLQTRLDHYETEMSYLNRILMECGFRKGIMTLKKTVESMLSKDEGDSKEEWNL
jgi:prefoldin subunit 5